jgi:hypothetical protein
MLLDDTVGFTEAVDFRRTVEFPGVLDGIEPFPRLVGIEDFGPPPPHPVPNFR